MTSGRPPPAASVCRFSQNSGKPRNEVFTVIPGLRSSKRSTTSWVARARESSPHQVNSRVTDPSSAAEPPQPAAVSATAEPSATQATRLGR